MKVEHYKRTFDQTRSWGSTTWRQRAMWQGCLPSGSSGGSWPASSATQTMGLFIAFGKAGAFPYSGLARAGRTAGLSRRSGHTFWTVCDGNTTSWVTWPYFEGFELAWKETQKRTIGHVTVTFFFLSLRLYLLHTVLSHIGLETLKSWEKVEDIYIQVWGLGWYIKYWLLTVRVFWGRESRTGEEFSLKWWHWPLNSLFVWCAGRIQPPGRKFSLVEQL